MKKNILLSTVILATLQLNGAFSRFAQTGRQLAPMLRSQLNTQPMHLPATMQKTCPAGMRLISSSSHSQGGYGYAGAQQQAAFGGREALLLGGAALVGKTIYDYWDTTEGRKLKCAHAAEHVAIDNPELAKFFTKSPYFIRYKPSSILELMEKYPDAQQQIVNTIISNVPSLVLANALRLPDEAYISWLANSLMKIYPESRQQLFNALFKELPNILEDARRSDDIPGLGMASYRLMTDILKNEPEFIDRIIDLTITTIIPNDMGRPVALDFVETMLAKYPASKERIIEAINKSARAREIMERRAEERRALETRKLEDKLKKEAEVKAHEEYFQRLVEA